MVDLICILAHYTQLRRENNSMAMEIIINEGFMSGFLNCLLFFLAMILPFCIEESFCHLLKHMAYSSFHILQWLTCEF